MSTSAITPYSYGPIELDTAAQRAATSGAATNPAGLSGGMSGLSSVSGAALLAYASSYTKKDDPAEKAQMENLLSAKQFDAEEGFRERHTAPGTTPSGPASEMPAGKPDDGSLINQGAYRGVPLGYGARTISQSGCALASLTMMSNRLNNRSTDLVQANQRVMDEGGFVPGTSDMDIGRGARAMNLAPTSDRMAATDANVAHAASAMNGGEMALAKVTHINSKGIERPHFLALEKAENGTITAADPSGGRRIQFRRVGENQWEEVPQNGVTHGYNLVSVQTFRGTARNGTEMASFRNPVQKA